MIGALQIAQGTSRHRVTGTVDSEAMATVEKLLGDAELLAVRWAVSSRTAVSEAQVAMDIRAPQRLCGHQIAGDYAAVQGASEETTPLSTVRGGTTRRQAGDHFGVWPVSSAAKSSVPVATAVAGAAMYSALRVVNCKARRAITSTAVRRSAARLKTCVGAKCG